MSEAIQASVLAYAVAVLRKAGDEESVKKIEHMLAKGRGPSQEDMDEVNPPEEAAPAEPAATDQPPA